MADTLRFSQNGDRATIYSEIVPQLGSLLAAEPDLVADLANIAAVLKESLGFYWVGFYLVKGDELVLGPFQGTLACTRIKHGEGVCGHAWEKRETVIVPDVDEFPGHIACSSASRSEIVVPIFNADATVAGVLDVDSDKLHDFSQIDADGLGRIVRLIERVIEGHTHPQMNE